MYSVLKFGGASIKDVKSIKNVGNILTNYLSKNTVIVFSAMGKVTNMLENVVECYFQKSKDPFKELDKVKNFIIIFSIIFFSKTMLFLTQ